VTAGFQGSYLEEAECQGECEADVKINSKPMSRKYEADAETNVKPMSRQTRSRRQEGNDSNLKR
jgi:hypothetical protein